jgi:hypothetical protein
MPVAPPETSATLPSSRLPISLSVHEKMRHIEP